jgi:hypothetical protein
MLGPRIVFLLLFSLAGAFAQLTPDQKVTDFLNLAGLYAKNYAPYEWKRDVYGFDLFNLRPWIDQVTGSKDDLDFYDICVRYVAGLKSGGHDRYLIPSSFTARLNFTVDLYDGKALIDSIDRAQLPASDFSFQIGDELVSVDGKAVEDLIGELEVYGIVSSPGAARRSAVQTITIRPQQRIARVVDLGDTASVVIERQNGARETYTIRWRKTGFPLTRVGPVPNFGLASADLENGPGEPPYLAILRRLQTVEAYGSDTVLGSGALAPIFALPDGFTQRLGRAAGDEFFSGTYKADSLTLGFIRIPSFTPSSQARAISQFEAEITFFQANTDGLVIDDMRNPGGSVSYLNALMQRLIPAPFQTVGYEIRATSLWISQFSFSLESAKAAGAEQWIVDLLQSLLDGVKQSNSENRGRTGPLPVDGLSLERAPARDRDGQLIAYTKPILVLADEFSASGGDLFPATIQDNARGPVFGMRTMGLGGTVTNFTVGAYSEGITRVTESLMNRRKPVVTQEFPAVPYVENIGVRPDIEADYMTKDNLLNRGRSFVSAFTGALVKLIQSGR